MRTLGLLALLVGLVACGGEDDPEKPTTITTQRSDTSTYGLLAEETTCADFVAMSESERLQTLRYIDVVKNIDTPGSSLETLARLAAELCEDDGLSDNGLDTVLVNYQ